MTLQYACKYLEERKKLFHSVYIKTILTNQPANLKSTHHKVVCTAGHIDHGKTALVKALTGMDTDRLSEEKMRGITIDLGFAFYGNHTTIIDLPGHERFIRNMAAGAATVDFALLIVAADDGPMPQTQEHLDILNLLGIKNGMAVITKADLAEEDWVELVTEEVKDIVKGTFLQDKPIMVVDSLSERGMQEFTQEFNQQLEQIQPRKSRPEYRQPVDRSFTIKGFGTVITGTVISGKVTLKDSVEILPSGKLAKVRGVQVHGEDMVTAETGIRAALNLSGVEKDEIARGDVLAQPGLLRPSLRFDCKVELLPQSPPLKHRQRLRFHLGTAEIIGRILLLESNILNPGDSTYAQIELEKPSMALRGDHFVFRTYSPQNTVGGGMILTTAEDKHKRRQKPLLKLLESMAQDDRENMTLNILLLAGTEGMTADEISNKTSFSKDEFTKVISGLVENRKVIEKKAGGTVWYAHQNALEEFKKDLQQAGETFHHNNPAKTGFSLAEIKGELDFSPESPFLEYSLIMLQDKGEIKKMGSLYALNSHEIKLNSRQKELSVKMLKLIDEAGLAPPKAHPIADRLQAEVEEIIDLMAILESMGQIIRLDRDMVISRPLYEKALQDIRRLGEEKGIIELPDAIEILAAGRRTTVAILEYLDRIGVTERDGDIRRLKS